MISEYRHFKFTHQGDKIAVSVNNIAHSAMFQDGFSLRIQPENGIRCCPRLYMQGGLQVKIRTGKEALLVQNELSTDAQTLNLYSYDSLNPECARRPSFLTVYNNVISGDSSVDINSTDEILVTCVVSSNSVAKFETLLVFSLLSTQLGQLLHAFPLPNGSRFTSVHISPQCRFLAVGISRNRNIENNDCPILLVINPKNLSDVSPFSSPIDFQTRHMIASFRGPAGLQCSTNSTKFHPVEGCGLAYGLDSGHIGYCFPTF
eukprot:Sdes_comp20129_c0_seq2m13192